MTCIKPRVNPALDTRTGVCVAPKRGGRAFSPRGPSGQRHSPPTAMTGPADMLATNTVCRVALANARGALNRLAGHTSANV